MSLSTRGLCALGWPRGHDNARVSAVAPALRFSDTPSVMRLGDRDPRAPALTQWPHIVRGPTPPAPERLGRGPGPPSGRFKARGTRHPDSPFGPGLEWDFVARAERGLSSSGRSDSPAGRGGEGTQFLRPQVLGGGGDCVVSGDPRRAR